MVSSDPISDYMQRHGVGFPEALEALAAQLGVHPAPLRKYTLARCTPYRCGSEIGERPVQIAVRWRIARHPDLPDKRPVYGVQYGSRAENMACIWTCTSC